MGRLAPRVIRLSALWLFFLSRSTLVHGFALSSRRTTRTYTRHGRAVEETSFDFDRQQYRRTPLTPLQQPLVSANRKASLLKASLAEPQQHDTPGDTQLPRTVLPILLSVLALIISEGIALSTLPLHMQSMGATPAIVGLSTSAFSIAQMVCCPLIVLVSSRHGRRQTLQVCLLGAALSSATLACATTIPWVIAARFLAGVFAAGIPVAQAGVTDLVTRDQAALALSRVSAASQTGLVIGPIVSAVWQGVLTRCGVHSKYKVRSVFAASAAFALFVLAVGGAGKDAPLTDSEQDTHGSSTTPLHYIAKTEEVVVPARPSRKSAFYVQPLLRIIALAAGWALTLSVSTYSLFSSRFLGYGQAQLSAAMSTGAATTILTQMLVVPRLIQTTGEHVSCTLGLLILMTGLSGMSLLRVQPWHMALYLLIRVGTGITDTATATLVALNSNSSQQRAANLGLIQSTRAAARIVTPVLSGSLFSMSCLSSGRFPGSLPYVVNAVLALALTPLPLLLKKLESRQAEER